MKPVEKKTGANQMVGSQGEELAVTFLEKQGYALLERNYRCKGGEVDIIARDAKTVVFVEVKTRRTSSYGVPQLAVTPFKQRQIMKAALTWLASHRKLEAPARFDVIAITIQGDREPVFDHIKNAFDLNY
jgi:putative endonuclease